MTSLSVAWLWLAAAVVGMFWGWADLMVALLIVIAAGMYGWRYPDLDDWRGH